MYTKFTTEEIKNKLKECLTRERYIHSLGVEETAIELAKRFSCNEEKAGVAGLLHDCAKCIPKEDCKKYMHLLSDDEKISEKTWHAPFGAYIARVDYGVFDNEILSAIRFHTIGKKDMSDFEKIIYLADKIETRTREFEYREPIVRVLNETDSLDEAVLQSFKMTINSLTLRNLPISFQTIDVYNNLLCPNKKSR